ncbi:hypothetical protein THASP1DRAFT_19586, partial [Thamnocephalis sphaerospora]
ITRAKMLLDVISLLLFLAGNYMVFTSSTCSATAPSLFLTTVILVLVGYFFFLIPLAFYGSVVFCLPLSTAPAASGETGTTWERVAPEHALCSICLADYEEGETLRQLQCHHYFHQSCVDQWLHINAHCPVCKQALLRSNKSHHNNRRADEEQQTETASSASPSPTPLSETSA